MEREVTQDDLNEIEEICYNDGYEIDDIQDAMTVLADELVKEMSYDYEPDILKGVKFIEYQIKFKQENNEYDIDKPVEPIDTGMPEDCSFYEAKQYLNSKGYILVEARGKTNIEDFNKMKSDVSQVTNIPGKNFEFVTGNAKGSVEDERSTMIIGWGNRGEYTYDTGRPGFSRYRKITREKVLDIIKEKQKEIEQLGYNVEFVDNNVKIWMPKSDLKPAEDETEMTLFGIFNDGGNCWSSRDDGHWYWTTSDGETAKEFRARLARAGERKAQQNYREYVKGSYGVRVFKNIEDFKKACEKVGLHPNLSDYE